MKDFQQCRGLMDKRILLNYSVRVPQHFNSNNSLRCANVQTVMHNPFAMDQANGVISLKGQTLI